MAKILFVQNLTAEYLGIMYISSALNKFGHKTAVAIGTNYKKDIYPRINKEKPDIIGISLMTFSQHWGLDISRNIQHDFPSIIIVFGGPHPTFFHDFINEKEVDIMVVGEAELAFADVVNAFENNDSITQIKNVHCKIDGKVFVNPIRPVVKNLDDLAFPDRNLYKPYHNKLSRNEMQSIITSRGCPFKCTYCYNNAIDNYYGNENKFVRTRSVENAIDELKQIKAEINPEKIMFNDDFFGLSGKKWVDNFLRQYTDIVGIPFFNVMRADYIAKNHDVAKSLKRAGCFQVCFGIESGNEQIRNNIIKKSLKNDDIISAADKLHDEGIYIRTCNLLGIPSESIENIYETIELNQKIKADFPHPYIFYPFPKTELTQLAIDSGLLDKNFNEDRTGMDNVKSFHHGSILNISYKMEIRNLHDLFQLSISYPYLTRFIKRWAKNNHSIINFTIYKLIMGWKFKKTFKLSWRRAITDFFR